MFRTLTKHDFSRAALGGLVICWLTLSGVAPVLLAQVSTADIVGTVTDASGAVIPGVKITATNIGTGLPFTTTTNASGEYVIPLLPAGHYRIQAAAVGFSTWSMADAELVIGARVRADAQLAVGAVGETLEVTAQAVALQTDSATVSTTVSPTQVANLPMNGRNFVMFALTVPGTSNYTGGSFASGNSLDDRRRSSVVSVNGRFGAESDFTLDGMDDNERAVGSVITRPSIEGLEEINVVTNTFSAELSRTAGAAIVMMTKPGANEFHGSLYEYLQNRIMNARPPNLVPGYSKPAFEQNNFGGSIGGPVKLGRLKNNTFFFFDWETYNQISGSVQLGTVPTAAMRQGNFAGVNRIYDVNTTIPAAGASSGYTRTEFPGDQIPASEILPLSTTILNMMPLPIIPGLVNNYERNGSRYQNDNEMDMRYDHRFTDKDNFFVRYSYGRTHTTQPSLMPETPQGYWLTGAGTAAQSDHGLGLSNTYTISPSMVLVMHGGFARYTLFSVQQGYGTDAATQLGLLNENIDLNTSGFPNFSFTNFTTIGAGAFQPDINFQNSFMGGGALQYSHGTHFFKFGGDVDRRQLTYYQSSAPMPSFAFTTGFTADPNNTSSTGNAIASFLLGYPATTTRTLYLVHPGYRYVEDGLYAQDDWRATRRLTVNIGVRWDYFSPKSEEYNRIDNWNPACVCLITPGVNGVGNTAGVTKDLKDFSPRLGFAYRIDSKTVFRAGTAITYDPTMQGTPGSFRNPPFDSALSYAPNSITPYNKYTDPIPYPTPADPINITGPIYAVQLNYKTPYAEQMNATFQRELPAGFFLSSSYVASLGKRQSGSNTSVDLNGTTVGSAPVNSRRILAAVYPNMTSLGTVMNYFTSSYNALQTSLSLRNRYGMVFTINHTWSHTIDDSEIRYYTTFLATRIKGTTPSDARNRVNITWNWALPYGKSSKAFYAPLIRNWRLNTVGVFQSGLPFSISQTGSQLNGATESGFGIATNGNGPLLVGSTALPSNPGINQWFNPAAFAPQPTYTLGNVGRDDMVAPGMWNFDLGIAREFRIKEKGTIQFRGEAFDFTNSEMPAAPVSTLGAPGFGYITSYTGSRIFQVALKVLF